MAILFASATPLKTAGAQEAPEWMKQTFPEQAVNLAMEEEKAIYNPKGGLDAIEKHLVGLGVAAQIPCEYCV